MLVALTKKKKNSKEKHILFRICNEGKFSDTSFPTWFINRAFRRRAEQEQEKGSRKKTSGGWILLKLIDFFFHIVEGIWIAVLRFYLKVSSNKGTDSKMKR